MFAFTFTVAPEAQGFFTHRSPSTWLEDLAGFAGIKNLSVGEPEGDRVTVIGDETALRFACVALNLHAEQTPWDSTPVEQGEALERVLAGEPVATDTDIVFALRDVGYRACTAYTPSRIAIALDAERLTEVLLTTNHNREDGGWEAVVDSEGDQYGLEDGPGVNASTSDVVAWVQRLHDGGWARF